MSPTEDDLRRALADGDGEVPDAGRIAIAAREHRERRRRRLLSAAATVVVVGGIATGGTYLAQHRSSPQAGSGADPRPTAEQTAAGSHNSTAASCPSHLPHALLPGGGGTTQFGSTGKIFAQPADTVTVCAYPSGTAGSQARVELTGSDATTFADSLENASKTTPRGMCEDYRLGNQESLAIVATTASGRQLPTVTTTINEPVCAVQVTNGTAVRYAWSWPSSLHRQLAEVSVAAQAGPEVSNSSSDPIAGLTSPGRVDGSPAH